LINQFYSILSTRKKILLLDNQHKSTHVFSGGYIEEILDNTSYSDLITLMQYTIENKRMITLRFTGKDKYMQQAIFAARLNGLTYFFNSIDTY
jgi:hypothetical protein